MILGNYCWQDCKVYTNLVTDFIPATLRQRCHVPETWVHFYFFCLHGSGKCLSRGLCQLIAVCFVDKEGRGTGMRRAACQLSVDWNPPFPSFNKSSERLIVLPRKQTWRGQPCHLLFSCSPLHHDLRLHSGCMWMQTLGSAGCGGCAAEMLLSV